MIDNSSILLVNKWENKSVNLELLEKQYNFTVDGPDYESIQLPVTIISTINVFGTLFGNILLIYVLLKNKALDRKKKFFSHQTLIFHMCVSDLCYVFFSLLPTLLISLFFVNYDFPQIFCKIQKYLSLIPMYASSFLLVATSLDRYYAICEPIQRLHYNFYKSPKFFAYASWIGALLCSIPNFFLWGKTEIAICDIIPENMWIVKGNTLFFIIFAWLLPCILAAILYYFVYRAAYKVNRLLCALPKNNDSKKDPSLHEISFLRKIMTSVTSPYNFLFSKNINQLNSITDSKIDGINRLQDDAFDKKKKQTIKLTVTIVIVSFLMYAPFSICNFLDFLNVKLGDGKIATYILFLGNLNSCTNPIIYFYFNFKYLTRVIQEIGKCLGFKNSFFVRSTSSMNTKTSNIIKNVKEHSSNENKE
uniref:G_PROTEIN_RECEP_F1_2 domain-containing protein n=1 Tax=Parastrongyloides trichosuri TaxID=131310 RepID=A0A0N4ZSH9_PARTI